MFEPDIFFEKNQDYYMIRSSNRFNIKNKIAAGVFAALFLFSSLTACAKVPNQPDDVDEAGVTRLADRF